VATEAEARDGESWDDVHGGEWGDFWQEVERPRLRLRRPRRAGSATHLTGTAAGRALIGAVLVLLAITIAGLVSLWPRAATHVGPSQALGGPTLSATVAGVQTVGCPGPTQQACRRLLVRLSEGRDRGSVQPITVGPVYAAPKVEVGAHVRVSRVTQYPGQPAAAERYTFVDYDRHAPLLWLTIAFGALVVVLARWRGLAALVGFGLSLLLVVRFLVPAIAQGSSPLEVSLVGALAVMFLTLTLTNGVGAQSLAAAVGIGSSLALATLLGSIYVHVAHLNGFSSELGPILAQQDSRISLPGVVVAGMVVGALGVLADMAVSQASSVMALRRANPAMSAGALYRGAFAVGRDHLAATTNTLVLAYVGAALPLLLVMHTSGVSFFEAVNTQDVAEAIVTTLVGGIALVLSVPATTGLASLLVSRMPVAALADAHHGHHH
jgi:uncharacterized membrane protein